jgi:hypothetical protein
METQEQETVEILETDVVNYWVYWPKHYPVDTSGFLDLRASLQFPTTDGRQYESVNCHKFFTDIVAETHALGITKRDRDNVHRAVSGKTPLVYTGYVYSSVKPITDIKFEDMHFKIRHTPETSLPNPAHCDIELIFSSTDNLKSRRKQAIERLIDALTVNMESYDEDQGDCGGGLRTFKDNLLPKTA